MKKIYFAEELNNPGLIKIGETSIEVTARLRQIQSQCPFLRLVCIGEFEAKKSNGSSFTDHQFHRYLINKGFECIRFDESNRDSEFFKITYSELIELFKTFTNEKQLTGSECILREEQQKCVDKWVSSSSITDTFGLWAQPRWGKTVACFEIMNKMFASHKQNVIIFLSSRSDIKTPIKEDYIKFKPSWNFNLIMQEDEYKFYNDKETNNILFCCTKQYIQQFDNIEDITKRLPFIKKGNILTVFYDEAHIAATTELTKRIINILNPVFKFFISGTPYSLLFNDCGFEFNETNSYHYNIFNEIKDIKSGKLTRNTCPELIFYTPSNPFFGELSDMTFAKFLVRKNEAIIIKWINRTLTSDYCYNLKKPIRNMRNLIFVVPRETKYCKFLRDCFNKVNNDPSSHLYHKINIFMASDKNSDINGFSRKNDVIYKQYNESSKNKNCYNILITLGKGLQSISYPENNSVIFWNDSETPESYMQASFRCKTPNHDGTKLVGNVIDYCSNRCLKLLTESWKCYIKYAKHRQPLNSDIIPIKILNDDLELYAHTFKDINKYFIEGLNLRKITNTYEVNYEFLANVDIPSIKQIFSGQYLVTNKIQLTDDKVAVTNEDNNHNDFHDYFVQRVFNDLINANNKILELFGFKNVYNKPYYNQIKNRYEHLGWFDFVTKQFISNELIYADETSVNSHGGGIWRFAEKSALCVGERTDLDRNGFVPLKGGRDGDTWKTETEIQKAKEFINMIATSIPFFILDIYGYNYQLCNSVEDLISMICNNEDIFLKYSKTSFQIFKDDILNALPHEAWENIIEKSKLMIKECITNNKWNEKLWSLLDDNYGVVQTIPEEIINEMNAINENKFDCSICGGRYSISENLKLFVASSEREKLIVTKLYPNLNVKYYENINEILKEGKTMKFDNIISNPPYNSGKIKIYHKCIDKILKLSDKATVICPDYFKKCNEAKNKITYYNHLGNIWSNVGIDVSIFKLDNNHNSSICNTPEGEYDFYSEFEEREEIKQKRIKERKVFYDKFNVFNQTLNDFKIGKNSLNTDLFENTDFVVTKSNIVKNFMLKDLTCIAVAYAGNINECYSTNVFVTKQCNICKTNSENQAYNLKMFLQTKIANFLSKGINNMDSWGGVNNIPIPDLNDNNIGDDNYLYHFYKLTQEEVDCIETSNYDKFIELNQE